MTNKFDFNLISKELAGKVNGCILGIPTADRVLLAVSTKERKSGNLILPDNAKDDIPKKGVVVAMGPISEDNVIRFSLEIGSVVSYGMYGGKEIYPEVDLPENDEEFKAIINDLKFFVLSTTEIIFIEPNLKF